MKNAILITVVSLLFASSFEKVYAQTISCTSPFISSDWYCLGPFESANDKCRMGKVISVWVDPSDKDHILAGTASSGLWETNDGGGTWANVFSYELPEVGAQKIAQARAFIEGPSYDINTIYCTTMFEASNMSRYGIGLVYYDPFDSKWKKEADENFPIDFVFDTDKEQHQLFYR